LTFYFDRNVVITRPDGILRPVVSVLALISVY
jgi:hypothetical protein